MFARTRLLAPLRSFSTAAEPSFDKGKFSVHFRLTPSPHPLNIEKTWSNPIGHQVWTNEEVASVQNTHRKRQYIHDYIAFGAIKTLRWAFDTATRYNPHAMSESKWLTRMIMLETVAGVPGMAGGMLRHLRSLRRMKRDHGWIHTLLEEAENERMHLLTFLELKKPSYPLRFAVLGAQGIFMNAFFLAYLIYPKVCHRFVGYLEEEAVRTYTHCLRDIDEGKVWNGVKAPEIAIAYWKLKADATMKDVILAIRADEANHRDVNHTFASLDGDDYNPLLLKELDKQNKTETQSH